MEDLNKNQIVLLTLLVSFVTSIATGIMTTSLLQVAPVEVTRNINRIVEKTIETVTPANPAIKQKEVTTIIVKEDDAISQTIDKNQKSIVRIIEKDPADTTSFYGIGLIVGADGLIAADKKIILPSNAYIATVSDGKTFTLTPLNLDKKSDIIFFKVNLPEKKSDFPYVFVPAVLGDAEPKLGQTVVTVGGEETNDIAVGRISSLETKNIGTTTTKYVTSIDTDLIFKDVESGSPLLNLTGSVIGIKLSSDTTKSFTPITILKKELQALSETKTQ